MLKHFFTFTLLLQLSPLFAAEPMRAEAVAELAKPLLEKNPKASLAIGVVKAGEQESFFFGEVELDGKKSKPDAETLYEIGSITKVFTGTLLGQMALEKKLKLDDPIQPHLPKEWKLPRRDDRDITFLHCTTHTSCLPVQPPSLPFFALGKKAQDDPYSVCDSEYVATSLASIELDRPIGSKHAYSNLAVGLLGHALVKIDGAKDYDELIQTRIAKPLGMKNTAVKHTKEQSAKFAPGHNHDGKVVSGWTFKTLEACGGIRSNVGDMLKFLDAATLREKTPLKDAFEFAQRPWRELSEKDVEIGLGWMRTTSSNGLMIWHNGGTGGYASFAAIHPKSGTAVIVLCNQAERGVDEMGMELLKIVAK